MPSRRCAATDALDHAAVPDGGALLDRCTVGVPLSFFGVGVRAWVAPDDVDDLAFFFGDHAATPSDPVHVEVAVWSPVGFFRSLLAKDGAPKWAALRELAGDARTGAGGVAGADGVAGDGVAGDGVAGDGVAGAGVAGAGGVAADERGATRHSFCGWSAMPSVLPPFASRMLSARVLVSRGTVVRSPSGVTVVLTGETYVGKTATAVALLEAGWSIASDHLLVVDRATGRALPYLSPLGFRRRTLAAMRDRLAAVPTRATVSEVTGPVVLARVADLYPGQVAGAAPVDLVVALERAEASGVHPLPTAPPLPTYPRGGEVALAARLGGATVAVRLGPGDGPERAAALVTAAAAAVTGTAGGPGADTRTGPATVATAAAAGRHGGIRPGGRGGRR